uniref:Uncharacterized protein n=1 Tax=Arundo donax TaxID=35708 RepID=A0A0A8YHU3_ARUDO
MPTYKPRTCWNVGKLSRFPWELFLVNLLLNSRIPSRPNRVTPVLNIYLHIYLLLNAGAMSC